MIAFITQTSVVERILSHLGNGLTPIEALLKLCELKERLEG